MGDVLRLTISDLATRMESYTLHEELGVGFVTVCFHSVAYGLQFLYD
jgi:hypothetical protein